MIKKLYIVLISVSFQLAALAQDTLPAFHEGYVVQGTDKKEYNKTRVAIVVAGNVALWAGSFYALNQSWYADFPRTSFHFFNDNREWQQMDKLGHVWTSYQVSRASAEIWKWTGINHKKSVIIGGLSGIGYLTLIEILDAYSSQWGFSWGDMTANLIGSGAFVSQELLWKEQRLSIKFSYWPYPYGDELSERRNQMFGKNFQERILKDYNSQTYWLSANPKSFFPRSSLPSWLNISVGYAADGMLGGRVNTWTDKAGVFIDRRDIKRVRHFYLAPDVDLTRIHTNKKLLKTLFFLLNAVKFPAPGIEVNSLGQVHLKAIIF